GQSSEDLDSRLAAYLEEDRRKGFELSKAPLMRLALIRTSEEEHYCAWSFHHILLDGWSTAIVLREVLSSYFAVREGRSPSLARPFAYREYVEWLERQDPAHARAFWSARLSDVERATSLGIGLRPEVPADERRKDGSRAVTLTSEETSSLSQFARAHKLTLSTVVQGAFALVSSRYSGEESVVFGTAVSGRECDLEGVESAVGLLMNTLPLRVKVEPRAQVVPWLRELQGELAAMRDFEWSPLVEVQRASAVPRGEPLFESILGFENYPVGNVADGVVSDSGALRVKKVQYFDNTHYPLALMVNPMGDRMRIRVSFDERRFTTDSMERLLRHLSSVLSGFVDRPEARLEDVPLLEESERLSLARAGGGERRTIEDVCIQESFERRAAERPQALAVASREGSIKYRELDRRANALAHRLRSLGVAPEVPVGLAMERSIEMIVGILGVLKAGGAYVSLEVSTPRERLAMMLREAGAPVVLTKSEWAPLFDGVEAKVIALDIEGGSSEAPPEPLARASNLAYVIFTSGSTGKPKSVGLTHRGLVNLVSWHGSAFGITEKDRATQLAGLGFDASVWEIWPYLGSGASLHIPDEETRLVASNLLAWMAAEGITASFLPTALAEAVLEEEMPERLGLRVLLTGGDKLHRGPRENLPFRLFNHY
ncbi:MAG: non-ribosomal peptide synthetase, partial [Vicinamibacteria bacterium]